MTWHVIVKRKDEEPFILASFEGENRAGRMAVKAAKQMEDLEDVKVERDLEEQSRRPNKFGEENPNAKINWEIVRHIRASYEGGESVSNIARRIGVHRTTVSYIVNKITWKETL